MWVIASPKSLEWIGYSQPRWKRDWRKRLRVKTQVLRLKLKSQASQLGVVTRGNLSPVTHRDVVPSHSWSSWVNGGNWLPPPLQELGIILHRIQPVLFHLSALVLTANTSTLLLCTNPTSTIPLRKCWPRGIKCVFLDNQQDHRPFSSKKSYWITVSNI